MQDFNLNQHQKISQRQTLSRQQIQSISILSLGQDELSKEIYRQVEENPALVIREENDSENHASRSDRIENSFGTSSKTTAAQELSSQAHQDMLESNPDQRRTLQDEFISQLNMSQYDEETKRFCLSLIENLDSRGHHILSPYSLSGKTTHHPKAFVDKCLSIVQHLDPAGCCVRNTEESLWIQAQEKGNISPTVEFLLKGHLDYLTTPAPEKVAKKINDYAQKLRSQFALSGDAEKFSHLTVSTPDVEQAISFIRKLDPFPARNFGNPEISFIHPDIEIKEVRDNNQEQPQEYVSGKTKRFFVELENYFPALEINPLVAQAKELTHEITDRIRNARLFMESIQYRQNTLYRTGLMILKKQTAFFENGPGNLVPYTQDQLSKELELNPSTVSRIAKNKFLRCEWGLFPISFFFSEAASSTQKDLSRDQVISEMETIITQEKDKSKKLSDQKISEILNQRGMKISRRTVAKYRSLLNVESSYNR